MNGFRRVAQKLCVSVDQRFSQNSSVLPEIALLVIELIVAFSLVNGQEKALAGY